MIHHPLIQRELIGLLRTGKAFGTLVAMVGVLVLLVLVRWPTGGTADYDGHAAGQVLRVLGYGMMTVLMLLAPAFAATSIVREKQQGTLALLLNSPLHPGSIVLGKLASTLILAVLMLILSLPSAAAVFAMGGVGLREQLLPMYSILFMLCLMYATLGILISRFSQTTEAAMRATYGMILVLSLVTLGPYALLHGLMLVPSWAMMGADWLRCLSPIPAMMQILGDGALATEGLRETAPLFERFILLSAGVSCLLFVWTAARMTPRLFDRTRDAGKITDDQSHTTQLYRRIMYLWFFDPQRRSGLIGPASNPVMVKEQRCRRFGRGHWMMRLIGACLIVSLLLMLAASTGSTEQSVGAMGGLMVGFQVSLILMMTPSLAGGLIASERESQGWRLLQMTPLSTWTIVTGKLMSVVMPLLLVLLATLPAYGVLVFIDPAQWTLALQVEVTLGLTAALSLLLTGAVSSLFKSTASATATSYALLMLLCVGTLLVWLGEDAPFSHATVEHVLRWNPLAAALTLIRAPGFTTYHLLPWNWWFTGGLCGLCLMVLVAQVWRLTRPQ